MEELYINKRKFQENLVKLINESGLPPLILRPTLKELLSQVEMLEEQQYQNSLNRLKENHKGKGDKK